MTVTPIHIAPDKAVLTETFGVELGTQMHATLEDFIALPRDEQMLAIFASLVSLHATLSQYQPLLEHAAKRLNGKRFGK